MLYDSFMTHLWLIYDVFFRQHIWWKSALTAPFGSLLSTTCVDLSHVLARHVSCDDWQSKRDTMWHVSHWQKLEISWNTVNFEICKMQQWNALFCIAMNGWEWCFWARCFLILVIPEDFKSIPCCWQMSQTVVRCWQGKKGVSWLRFGPHAGGLGRDQRDQNRKRWNSGDLGRPGETWGDMEHRERDVLGTCCCIHCLLEVQTEKAWKTRIENGIATRIEKWHWREIARI